MLQSRCEWMIHSLVLTLITEGDNTCSAVVLSDCWHLVVETTRPNNFSACFAVLLNVCVGQNWSDFTGYQVLPGDASRFQPISYPICFSSTSASANSVNLTLSCSGRDYSTHNASVPHNASAPRMRWDPLGLMCVLFLVHNGCVPSRLFLTLHFIALCYLQEDYVALHLNNGKEHSFSSRKWFSPENSVGEVGWESRSHST